MYVYACVCVPYLCTLEKDDLKLMVRLSVYHLVHLPA